jgi:glucose-6-phosphate 1-dehydrogenase
MFCSFFCDEPESHPRGNIIKQINDPTMSTDNDPLYLRTQLDSNFSFRTDKEFVVDEPKTINQAVSREDWHKQVLSIVVVGASGDLAKKKTYPSLLNLYEENLLPKEVIIYGYARSSKTHDELRQHLFPHLIKTGASEQLVKGFLERCFYYSGRTYGDKKAYSTMVTDLVDFENRSESRVANRLFYLAVPPNVFGQSGVVIKQVGMSTTGWTRVVVEKPFGRDLDSCNELLKSLSDDFEEDHLYRIDHYLGKEVVQNLMLFRFGNPIWEPIWNRDNIESVTLTFKEPFGTDGRGGYFDQFGIIRDILQNHLLQVLTLFAMEPPESDDADAVRDAKLEVLKHMDVITLEDCLLGQYDGYSDDPTIENKETNCPTYAAIRCWIHTPRWEGVPFILQAGKALDEKLVDVKARFRSPKTMKSVQSFSKKIEPSELVLRLQPNPALELHNNIKTPGLSFQPMKGKMTMNYEEIPDLSNPDAYTRLLLSVMRGDQGSFVRDDELRRSWEIFTPLLHSIDDTGVRPQPYKQKSTGPDDLAKWMDLMMKPDSSLKSSL